MSDSPEFKDAIALSVTDPKTYHSDARQSYVDSLLEGGGRQAALRARDADKEYRDAFALAHTDPKAYHSPAHQAYVNALIQERLTGRGDRSASRPGQRDISDTPLAVMDNPVGGFVGIIEANLRKTGRGRMSSGNSTICRMRCTSSSMQRERPSASSVRSYPRKQTIGNR
jgi:hypothetical protein